MGGLCARHASSWVAISKFREMRNSDNSEKSGPINCTPMGSPFWLVPAGMDIAGTHCDLALARPDRRLDECTKRKFSNPVGEGLTWASH